jgi:hypothetical protein
VPDRLRTLGVKLYGQPPAKGAPRSERLRYERRAWIGYLPFVVGAVVAAAVWGRTWTLVVFAAFGLFWIQAFASISLRARREQRREQNTDEIPGGE